MGTGLKEQGNISKHRGDEKLIQCVLVNVLTTYWDGGRGLCMCVYVHMCATYVYTYTYKFIINCTDIKDV